MKFRFLYVVLFLVSVSPASATDFYVGFNVGAVEQSGDFTLLDSNPPTGATSTAVKDYQTPDDSAQTRSFFIGYKLGSDLALEVGAANNGKIESAIRTLNSGNGGIETTETDYTYVAFVGLWPIKNNWAFNARLGFSVWQINYTQTEVNTALPETDTNYIIQEQALSDNTSAILLGVGLSYGLNENIEFKFNVENHFVDFAFTNLELDYSSLTYTFGTAYHF